MPGRVFLKTPIAEVASALGAVADPSAAEGPRLDIAPGEEIRVLTPGRRLSNMRWGLIPMGRKNARGRPVMETIVNARSETVFDKSAFDGVGRGVVPVNGWYEWTGTKGRKTRWQIAPKSGALLFFAAITDVWQGPGGMAVPQVATVTTEPNAEVGEIHHRMAAILDLADIPVWLDADLLLAKALLRPLEEGRLDIRKADPNLGN